MPTTSQMERTATYAGASVAFVIFLFEGIVPGLLYGKHLGAMMGDSLFGLTDGTTLLAKFMTGGGMALGLLASLALFLVFGGFVGTIVGALLAVWIPKERRSDPEKAAASEEQTPTPKPAK